MDCHTGVSNRCRPSARLRSHQVVHGGMRSQPVVRHSRKGARRRLRRRAGAKTPSCVGGLRPERHAGSCRRWSRAVHGLSLRPRFSGEFSVVGRTLVCSFFAMDFHARTFNHDWRARLLRSRRADQGFHDVGALATPIAPKRANDCPGQHGAYRVVSSSKQGCYPCLAQHRD